MISRAIRRLVPWSAVVVAFVLLFAMAADARRAWAQAPAQAANARAPASLSPSLSPSVAPSR